MDRRQAEVVASAIRKGQTDLVPKADTVALTILSRSTGLWPF